MSEPPTTWRERTGRDADGTVVREYDHVVLLRDLEPTGQSNCPTMPTRIPAGTHAVAILLIDEATSRFDLECDLDEAHFAFCDAGPQDIRLVERRFEPDPP